MKLLLHTCCAPCAIYPIRKAREDGISLSGLFFNVNIQPFTEYKKRKEEAGALFKVEDLRLFFAEYSPEEFFKFISKKDPAPKRCLLCWQLRLWKTAEFAKANNFNAFTTTLLGSPYQDHEALKEIGQKISDKTGVKFYYCDYRKGFSEAHKKAKASGIYCQNYCGCVFSMVEREEAKKRKKRSAQSV